MAIRKIGSVIVLLASLMISDRMMGQVRDDIVNRVDRMYSHFYNAEMQMVSPNNKRGIVTHKNEYGIRRAFILNLKTNIKDTIPYASKYDFFGDDVLIAQLGDRTILTHLGDHTVKEITGNLIYVPFQREGKFLLYDRSHGQMSIYDGTLKVISSFQDIENVSMLNDRPSAVFATKTKLYMMDLKSLHISEWSLDNSIKWLQRSRSEVLTIESLRGKFFLNRYYGKSARRAEEMILPKDFYIDSLSLYRVEVRNERYLILPVRKIDTRKVDAKNNIRYTNQSSIYNKPLVQMAIYDIEKEVWKRLPESSDIFSTQFFADGHGTVLSYDPSEDKVDSLGNVRYNITLEREFGGNRIKIDNPYVERMNFHFDTGSARMIYFKDHRWWIQDTKEGTVHKIPFEEPSYFISDRNSGLGDDPSGNIYPTNHYAKYLMSDGYDFFLVDLLKVSVKRLTFGREKNISYSIPADRPKVFNSTSIWGISKNPEVDMDDKILLRVFDKISYGSGIAEFDFRTSECTELFRLDDVIKNVFISDKSVIFTSQSYGRPLSVYSINHRGLGLIYRSLGVDKGDLDILKKEMIQYDVDGKTYNAVLLYPVNYDYQNQYPVIFNIYENKSKDVLNFMIPDLYANQGFNAMHYVYNGYFVLLPDLAFEPGHIGRSISRSVDALVNILKKKEFVDIKKMAVVGSSFGGYGTTFLLTQDKWFITGFAGVSVVDLPSKAMGFYRDFDLPSYFKVEKQQNRMVKNLFENYQGYLDNSPMYHLKKMTRPILMWVGKEDGNVDPNQSRSFFLGLKRLGKKGVLIEYPGERHTLTKRENQFDINVKGWQWMDYYLKDERPAEWILPLLE